MTKIHFLTPCYGGNITEVCFSSYLQFTIMALQNNINFQVDTLSNESNVNRARNSCTAKFLNGDATHLMFVDADIQFNPADIVKLINHDKDIVGGIYPQKTLPPKMVVNTINNGKVEGDLIEVGTLGTGFMLVKRRVFEEMIKHGATPYVDDIGLSKEENANQYDFFQCTIDSQGRYLTEDWSFCRRWRQLGGSIWADKTIALTHVGYFRFPPNMEALNGKS
tara:strand:+ start:4694 stop:5359 length:666 start_codon:yes stop_codon:yes gene_type:complete